MNISSEFKPKYIKVCNDYNAAYPDPLKVTEGEIMIIIRDDAEWPGWIWCRNSNGKEGWVPKNYARIEKNQAVMICDYNAAELTVSSGEKLLILKKESNWFWCRNDSGVEGWVPETHMVEVD
jgi:uncharacterized protein YgiM (DUF1202 family)